MKTSYDKKRLFLIAAAVALLVVLLLTSATLLLLHGGDGTQPRSGDVQQNEQAETEGNQEPEEPRTMTRLKVAAQFIWADFKGWVSRQFSDEPPAGDPIF